MAESGRPILLAESPTVAALGEIEMEMVRVVGVAAGAEHGPERTACGRAHFREKQRMLRIAGGVHVDQRAVRQGETLPKACSDNLTVPLRGRQT